MVQMPALLSFGNPFGMLGRRPEEMVHCNPYCKAFDFAPLEMLVVFIMFAIFGSSKGYKYVREVFRFREFRKSQFATLIQAIIYTFFTWIVALCLRIRFNGYMLLVLAIFFFLFNNIILLRWLNRGACRHLHLVKKDDHKKRSFWGVLIGDFIQALVLLFFAWVFACPAFAGHVDVVMI